jgi:putative flippase GtrA
MDRIIKSKFFIFLVVGGINTAVNYGVYAFFIFVGLGHIIAASCAFAVGMVFNFKTHGKFVFGAGNKNSFYLYVVCWLVIYCINIGVLDLLIRSGVDSYLAGLLMIPPMAVLAFLVLRFVVFRSTADAD